MLRVRELSPDSTPINEVPCCLLSEVGMQNSAQDNWDLSLLAASPAYVQDTSPAPHCTGMIWAPAGDIDAKFVILLSGLEPCRHPHMRQLFVASRSGGRCPCSERPAEPRPAAASGAGPPSQQHRSPAPRSWSLWLPAGPPMASLRMAWTWTSPLTQAATGCAARAASSCSTAGCTPFQEPEQLRPCWCVAEPWHQQKQRCMLP